MSKATHEILAERQKPYMDAYQKHLDTANALKLEFGDWKDIPNEHRTAIANELREAGRLYGAGGWECPNSVALSSSRYKGKDMESIELIIMK